ncbi:MAG: hypothetical protein KME17_23855 [Cyanosarcina radialis HA8281-LM2]|jgi:hypothetical protein|nr:hypothetical protein [Cyanosarcina radialis HA8281-LM2]
MSWNLERRGGGWYRLSFPPKLKEAATERLQEIGCRQISLKGGQLQFACEKETADYIDRQIKSLS